MRHQKIIPIILAGGFGNRLYPLSTEACPKQFLKLTHPTLSLLQQTLQRVSLPELFLEPVVVCNEMHRDLALEQGGNGVKIILEPHSKNTAPAASLGVLYANEMEEDQLMILLPADHYIEDKEAFHSSIRAALPYVKEGNIVTFGVTPSYAETGYGYIKSAHRLAEGVHKAFQFIEKPDVKRASRMLASGDYYWNSGVFLMRKSRFIDAAQQHMKNLWELCAHSYASARKDGNILYVDEKYFSRLPSISIDHAMMEKVGEMVVVALDAGWTDLGSFQALAKVSPEYSRFIEKTA